MDVEKQNDHDGQRQENVVAIPVANKRSARKIVIGGALAGLLVLVGIVVGVTASNRRSSKSSAGTISTPEDAVFEDVVAAIPDGVSSLGCFRREDSIDTRTLQRSNIVEDCSKDCFSQFFGIADNLCACFVDNLDQRLSLGSCSSVKKEDALAVERMEMYFKQDVSQACSQERTETVRNFLVEEDDAPFGFDIVENRFRSSPFQLFKDECGTNIYEVQTEVSEGSQLLDTKVEDISSFSTRRRSERTASLDTNAEASYNGLFYSAAI